MSPPSPRLSPNQRAVRKPCRSLGSFIVPNDNVALRSPGKNQSITYKSLRKFIDKFNIPLPVVDETDSKSIATQKPIVCIAIPNGPVLAAICLAVANRYIAAPINRDLSVGPDQFQADVLASGASFILTAIGDVDRLQLSGPSSWAVKQGIMVFAVAYHDGPGELDYESLASLTLTDMVDASSSSIPPHPEPNTGEDIAIILFTSGTSGTKKIVPITLNNIVSGVGSVIKSWDLEEGDVCLNMMPLFHIGGLIRNILSPLFSGGSVICCPVFDPNMFWDVLEEEGSQGPTWYYASPSMHQMILDEATSRHAAMRTAQDRIRLVCNAAGGLLPVLACQLRDCFQCTVLPSYGMTECMPISTPPVRSYQLDRPGTSGVSVGPELGILDKQNTPVPPETIGHISVRGEPVFPGYLTPTGELDISAFTKDGWFDTGDLGYLDSDGFLFITGRSKEVINRGGEIFSPFEVEQAIIAAAQDPNSPIHNRVSQCLAFSVPHDILQEVVGVALVTPSKSCRADLRQLHQALQSQLQQAKLPTLVVYMDDLPRRNNKVLRIGLSNRLNLPELTDQTRYCELHWEATCPDPDTEISVKVPSRICEIDETYPKLSQIIEPALLPFGATHAIIQNELSGALEVCISPAVEIPDGEKLELFKNSVKAVMPEIQDRIALSVHGHLTPHMYTLLTQPIPFLPNGHLDKPVLSSLISSQLNHSNLHKDRTATTIESRVTSIFSKILSLPPSDIPPTKPFLLLGGDSLRAGKLLSALRSEFTTPIPISLIFQHGSISTISAHLHTSLPTPFSSSITPPSSQPTPNKPTRPQIPPTPNQAPTSTSPPLLLFHLTPLTLIYPLRRSAQWTLFLLTLAALKSAPTSFSTPGRLLNIVVASLLAQTVISLIFPLLGILSKWVIIARHKEGIYPMWGTYHTRWWIVQKVVSICGMGVFGATNWSRVWYYRLLGARIAGKVELNGAVLGGEWDLLEIGEGAVLAGRVHVRPFAVEGGVSMFLGRIVIGRGASIGPGSFLAPGTRISEGAHLGANSSSWEVGEGGGADPLGAPYTAGRPHWVVEVFGTAPILGLARGVRAIPWLMGILGMVMSHPLDTLTPVISIIQWFSGTQRVLFHFLAVSMGAVFGPMVLFGVVLGVKRGFDLALGPATGGEVKRFGQVEKWRVCLIKDLFPEPALHELMSLFGQHYEMTSRIMRLLGAKVGKRVYWPGTGPNIGDYHLVDVGDDVVFGSRANLVTSDGIGSEKIVIRDRAMVADRVTLLPGVTVGQDTVLGSGALTKRGKTYVDGGVYIGSKGGDAICLSSGAAGISSSSDISDVDTVDSVEKATSISTPFGRAFYRGEAPYYVIGQIPITIYCMAIKVFTTVYWNIPFIASIQIFDHIHRREHAFLGMSEGSLHPLLLFGLFTLSYSILVSFQSLLALGIVIAAKWLLIGRRQPGNYSWDKSSYCQRWQLFLAIESLRRDCFRGSGILGMLTGTHWMVMYFRALGAEIGKDCALFANGDPSLLFTEPDLLKLGNRVAVDDASLVGHINTRGKFDLNCLVVGDGCVLRSGSRLLSGGIMEAGSCLMEHTLIMGGEVVEKGKTVQGWPGEVCG